MIVTDLVILGFGLFLFVSFIVYCIAIREPMYRKNLSMYFPLTQTTSEFKRSDIVFFSSGTKYDIKDHILRLGGSSHLTHVGIIVEFCGYPYIFESVGMGVRLRPAQKLNNFLKRNKNNSLFIRRLNENSTSNTLNIDQTFDINQKLHQSVKKYMNKNYSYDFMPLYYKRVVNFLPLPIQKSEYINSKHKSGYSCLSLVKTILGNDLHSNKLLQMNNDIKSLQELFELSQLDIFNEQFYYSEPLFFSSSLI